MKTLDNKELLLNEMIPFGCMVEQAERIQKECNDYMVKKVGENMFMSPDGNLNFCLDDANTYSLPLSRWSLGQLGTKIDVPGRYLERCIDSGHGQLAADNVNTWLKSMDKSNMLVREYQGSVRGLLSNRYAICDAPDILSGLLNDIFAENEWDIRGSFVNEERLHLRMTQKHSMKVDGGLFPAVFIDSSDVGRCALRVSFGIYRLACTNGLVIPAVYMKYHQKHVGINRDDFLRIVAQSLTKVPDMIEYSSELIHYASEKEVKLITDSDIDLVVSQIRNATKLSDKDAREVVKLTLTSYEPTQWGIVNGITEFAQTKTLETRLELEEAAGILLAAA